MKKILLTEIVILVGILIFGACAAASPSPVQPMAYKWPSLWKMGVTAIGGSSYALAAAWTPVMEQATGMKIRLVPERSTATTERWVKQGVVDTGFDTASVLGPDGMEATCGTGWDTREGGPYPMRVIWLSQMSWWGFMVRGNSNIKTLYDIKPGTRISVFTGSPGVVITTDCMLAWIKLKKSDVTIVPAADLATSVKLVADGKADVVYASSVASATFEAQAGRDGIRFLEMDALKDPEGAKRFVAAGKRGVAFDRCKKGVKEALGIPMIVAPFVMVTGADKDAEWVYNVAKWLHQNYEAYKNKHADCENMHIDLFRDYLNTCFLPNHDGTIKYLKEIGKWTSDDDARQKYNVELGNRYIKAYEKAIADADAKKITIESGKKEWCELWASHKKDLPLYDVMYQTPK